MQKGLSLLLFLALFNNQGSRVTLLALSQSVENLLH